MGHTVSVATTHHHGCRVKVALVSYHANNGCGYVPKSFLYKIRGWAGFGPLAIVYLSLIYAIKVLKRLHVKLLNNFRPKHSKYNHYKVVKAVFLKL